MSTNPGADTHGEVPDRTLQQRKEALQKANDIRFYRADLKRDLKHGRVDLIKLLREPPEKLNTMKVFELLISVPKFGYVKVNKLLNKCRMSPSKTVGGMSDRQRSELIQALLRRET